MLKCGKRIHFHFKTQQEKRLYEGKICLISRIKSAQKTEKGQKILGRLCECFEQQWGKLDFILLKNIDDSSSNNKTLSLVI